MAGKAGLGDDGAMSTTKILRRSSADRKLAGVCGGLGRYFGIDANILRVGIVILTFFNGVGLLLYFLAAIIIPSDAAPDGQGQARVAQRPHSWVWILLVALLTMSVLSGLRDHTSFVGIVLVALVGVFLYRWSRSRRAPTTPSEFARARDAWQDRLDSVGRQVQSTPPNAPWQAGQPVADFAGTMPQAASFAGPIPQAAAYASPGVTAPATPASAAATLSYAAPLPQQRSPLDLDPLTPVDGGAPEPLGYDFTGFTASPIPVDSYYATQPPQQQVATVPTRTATKRRHAKSLGAVTIAAAIFVVGFLSSAVYGWGAWSYGAYPMATPMGGLAISGVSVSPLPMLCLAAVTGILGIALLASRRLGRPRWLVPATVVSTLALLFSPILVNVVGG